MKNQLRSAVNSWEPFECPVCCSKDVGGAFFVHTDGNKKLVLLREGGRKDLTREGSYTGTCRFFVSNSTRDAHMEVYYAGVGGATEADDPSCGDATFKALTSSERGYDAVVHTGIVAAACRHYFLLRAVNMDCGEKFALHHVLEHDLVTSFGVRQIAHVRSF